MNRSTQRKLSRALVGGLGLTLALGGVFWLGKVVGSNSTSAQHAKAERGGTTEEVVAAKAAAANAPGGAGGASGAGSAGAATPTTKPSSASDAFNAQIARANVLETPTTPVSTVTPSGTSSSSASSASSVKPSTQPSSTGAITTPPLLAAGAGAGSATTRPTEAGLIVNGAPAITGTNVQLASNSSSSSAAPEAVSANPIADAKIKIEHGKTLDARRILNTAITSNQLAEADVKAAKQMLNEINATVVFSTRRFEQDEFGGNFVVPDRGVLERIAKSHDITPQLLQKINGISDPKKLQAQRPIKVLKGPFNAVVDKSDFTLELWLGEPGAKGSMYVTSLPVGLGADDSTPTGVWAVKNRVPNPAYFSPRGEGIIAADDPKNPLGEFWVGLSGNEGNAVGKESYGIHGTIEPDTIGKQASMGCIRLTNENVQKVFEALVEGKSTVTVKD